MGIRYGGKIWAGNGAGDPLGVFRAAYYAPGTCVAAIEFETRRTREEIERNLEEREELVTRH